MREKTGAHNLISNTHKFMINLSHAHYSEKKQIVLYIPTENLRDSDHLVKDKDLIARLDSIMIEWTNQIRDFISNQENYNSPQYHK